MRNGAGHTDVQECIEHCLECHAASVAYAAHLLQRNGGAHNRLIVLLLDCAQICSTSAEFMLRGSTLHHLTCAACAEVCEECADACDPLDSVAGDVIPGHCADVCRRCAASCREMAVEHMAGAARD
jgi:hypothetical protein